MIDLLQSFDKFLRMARGYVWDTDLLEWVAMTQPGGTGAGLTDAELRASDVKVSLDGETITVDPTIMVDVDATIGWTGDKPTSIALTRGAQTKTMTLGWTGENLTSISTVIT